MLHNPSSAIATKANDRGGLALYIHWPFCVSKCPYCDFNSHVRSDIDVDDWRSALIFDLRHEHQVNPAPTIGSIFFGGGTPSLMPPQLVADLIAQADDLWGLSPQCDITLEANPSSVEAARFSELALAGVNRISLGLQSLDDQSLRFLGRAHSVDESLVALDIAQQNFARMSFDLIYARPGQSIDAWESELTRAIRFGTGHLSLYQLTIEPGTQFETLVRTGKLTPADDDHCADLFEITRQITTAAGIPAYEISNHARAGQESQHNLTYWRYQDYVGIGPGAHGRRGGMATQRHKKPENFLAAITRNGHGLQEERLLPPQEQAVEALLMGLRLAEGIAPDEMAARFGLSVWQMLDKAAIGRLSRLGLLRAEGSRLHVTAKGMPLLDAILPEIVAVTAG
ncbi:radical SAM family heme chaperone HemW [Sphingorhabdus arenilitoris]|uniref:Heme chaperone HemW n=1 Tax=Sphingorhabdus arenilitoris TaxID=1490041 RepID=A0ABV8RE54_9SPHN